MHLSKTSFNFHLLWVKNTVLLYVYFLDGLKPSPAAKKLLENVFPTWGIPSDCSLKAIYIAPPYDMGLGPVTVFLPQLCEMSSLH